MTSVSPEVRRATLISRCFVLVVALAILAATLLTVVQKAIAVPELKHGILRDETTVQIEMLPPPAPEKEPMVEHLAEKSDFEVDARPEPPKEAPPKVESLPDPPKIEPPKPLPKPKPPEKRQVVKKPAPVKKAVPVAREAMKESTGATAPAAASGGAAPSPVAGTASGNSPEARSQALAEIIAVIDAHKRYPRRARQTGAEGDVVLAVSIDASGTVTNVVLKTPNASVLLNRAALKAAEPLIGRKLPLTAPLTVEVPVRFTISS